MQGPILEHRKEQISKTQVWLDGHTEFSCQINLFVKGTSDCICVSLHGEEAKDLSTVIVPLLKRQLVKIENL